MVNLNLIEKIIGSFQINIQFLLGYSIILGLGSKFLSIRFWKDKEVFSANSITNCSITGLSLWIITHRFFLREASLTFFYKLISTLILLYGFYLFIRFVIDNRLNFQKLRLKTKLFSIAAIYTSGFIFLYPLFSKGIYIVLGNVDVYGHFWLLDAINKGFDWHMGIKMFEEWTGSDKWYSLLGVWRLPDFKYAQYIEWVNRSTRYAFPLLVNSLSRISFAENNQSVIASLWMSSTLTTLVIYSRLKIITNNPLASLISSFLFTISTLGGWFYYSGIYSQIICTPFIIYACSLPFTHAFGLEKNSIKNFTIAVLVYSALFSIWGEGLQIVFIFYVISAIIVLIYFLLGSKNERINIHWKFYFDSTKWILISLFTSVLISFIYASDWIKWSYKRLSENNGGGIGYIEWNFIDIFLGNTGLKTTLNNKDFVLNVERLSSSTQRFWICLLFILIVIFLTLMNDLLNKQLERKVSLTSSSIALTGLITCIFFNHMGNLYALVKVGYILSPFILQNLFLNFSYFANNINLKFIRQTTKTIFVLGILYHSLINFKILKSYSDPLPEYKIPIEYSNFRKKFPSNKRIAIITPTDQWHYLSMAGEEQMYYLNSAWSPQFNTEDEQNATIYSYVNCDIDYNLPTCKKDGAANIRNKLFIKEDIRLKNLLKDDNSVDLEKLKKTIKNIFS